MPLFDLNRLKFYTRPVDDYVHGENPRFFLNDWKPKFIEMNRYFKKRFNLYAKIFIK